MKSKAEMDALTEKLEKQQLQDVIWEAFTMLTYPRQRSLEATMKRMGLKPEPKKGTGTAAAVKKRMKEVPAGEDPKEHAFHVAEEQARTFMQLAWSGVYTKDAGFDNVISREEYLHWDVPVRASLKAIQAIGPESPSFREAVELTMELFELFCFSNEYSLLRKKQTFHFLNTRHDTFLQQLLDRIQQAYPREEAIPKMVQVTSYLGPDLWETDIFFLGRILVRSLKTEENRKLALAEAQRLCEAAEKNPKSYYKVVKDKDKDQWFQRRYLANLMNLAGMLESSLSREALERQVRESLTDRDQPDYHLYQFLRHTQNDEIWKLVYETGVSMGIQTREKDQEKYRRLTAGT